MDVQTQPVTEEKTIQESVVTTQPIQGEIKEETPKSSKEWDKFKEARANERKQAEEVARQAEKSAAEAAALKAALDSVLNRNQPQYQNPDYHQEETEDQRIEKKVADLLAKREAESERQKQQREQQEYPERLNQTFPDFNQVCSDENCDYLQYHFPEVAVAFKHMPQGYEKWAAIYQAVKRFVPNNDSRKDQKKAEQNMQKPMSMSSPQVSTTGQTPSPIRLDEARKAANWERMQRARNGLT